MMNQEEQINETTKMLWCENIKLVSELKTQVSGYIFNDQNQLLIVNNKNWTIPGGHFEIGEEEIDTLNREAMEESYVTLKDIKYLGAVHVSENNQDYYQMRYTARINEIKPFLGEWEVSERKFVDVNELAKYIKWANGTTFKAQITSALKQMNI